jgi:hypothetical protein
MVAPWVKVVKDELSTSNIQVGCRFAFQANPYSSPQFNIKLEFADGVP